VPIRPNAMWTKPLKRFAETLAVLAAASTQTEAPPATMPTAAPVPAAAPVGTSVNQAPPVIPSHITLEMKVAPTSGVGTWSAVIVPIIAALASIGAAIYTATANIRGQLRVKAEDAALQKRLQDAAHEHEGGIEDRRLRHARRELATNRHLTEAEREQTAWKIVHDQKIEEAKLIHMFLDKLVSKDQREQDIALFAIAAFVDPSVIQQLVSGSGVVSSVSASRLAASGDSEAAQAAQAALNQFFSLAAEAVVFVHLGDSDLASCTGFFVTPTLLASYALADHGDTIAFQFERFGLSGNARVVAVDRGNSLGWPNFRVGSTSCRWISLEGRLSRTKRQR
jgi:hypothetical protein